MKQPIKIYPSRIRQFGSTQNATFCLLTNSEFLDTFSIIEDADYKNYIKVAYDHTDSFTDILSKKIPENTHILAITPNCLFHSVDPQKLGKRKLLIFASNSAPTSIEAIEHFLRCGEKTDPQEQEERSNNFFDQVEITDHILLTDKTAQSELHFNHHGEDYGWHEQTGSVDWGQQQVYPPGEIACFLVPLKANAINNALRFDMNGTIPFKGYPVLHSGPPSFLTSDQERIYNALSTIKNHPVNATVQNGEILSLEPTHNECIPAYDILSKMFEVDSRFRIIYEVGFALNHHVVPIDANSAMNEVAAGKNGTVHFGLGMLPYTQYHLDIICPDISVLNKNGHVIFGKELSKIKRTKSAACPCLEGTM